MTIQYHVKGLITLISGVVTILLMTSPIWSNISYVEQGIASLVITGIMSWLLWADYRKLQAAAETAAGNGNDAESSVEELEEVESAEQPVSRVLDESSEVRHTTAKATMVEAPAVTDSDDHPVVQSDPEDQVEASESVASEATYTPLLSGLFVKQKR